MKTIVEKLPANEFARVHRSYIVSIKRIDSVKEKNIVMGTQTIPIGISYEEAFAKEYMRGK